MNPLITIIIPTYNRAHIIQETLESVLTQSYKNWQCIVVDDGSTDGTNKLMKDHCRKNFRFQYLNRKSNIKGAPQCRNEGLAVAKGSYCIFLDSDDLLLDFCLEKRIKSIENSTNSKFWVFPMFTQGFDGTRRVHKIPQKDSYFKDFLSYNLYWQTMCTFWKTEFVKSIGGFNVLLPRLNDPEIHLRAMLKSGGNYIVFSNSSPDSVYRNALFPKSKPQYAKVYFQALKIFIPDIVEQLEKSSYTEFRGLLKAYLRDYMQGIFAYNTRSENNELLKIFSDHKIISLSTYNKLLLYFYLFSGSYKISRIVKKRIYHLLSR